MKKVVTALLCILCFILVGCNEQKSDPCDLTTGTYYAMGDYEENWVPYVAFDFEDYTFRIGDGQLISYADFGTFSVKKGQIIAESQLTTYVFEIVDSTRVALVKEGDTDISKSPVTYEKYVGE
ncbi:MAG: hypothetical protein IJ400_02720 [Clostridia bacterium]|nr:hypothetical protein [Clostridia bacterium]